MRTSTVILLLALLWAPAASAQMFNPWPPNACPPGSTCENCPDQGQVTRPASPSRKTSAATSPQPAIVRVISEVDDEIWLGSGVLTEPTENLAPGLGLVLTADHTLPANPASVRVVFSGGQQVVADIIGRDTVGDLAALSIPMPRVVPYKIAMEAPQVGDTLWAAGYATATGHFECVRGRLLHYATDESLMVAGSVRDGVSGGPIISERGERGRLAGIVSLSDHEFVVGSHCGLIRQFLARIFRPATPEGMSPMNPPPSAETPLIADPPQTLPPSTISVADHLDKIRGQIAADLAAARQVDSGRFDVIEASLAGLANTSKQVTAIGGPSWIGAALPGALAALGWSAPPSVAALLALRTGGWLIRRRRKRRATKDAIEPEPVDAKEDGAVADAADAFHAPGIPRDDTEARQFLQLSELEGRSPLHDALIGRFTFDELQDTIDRKPAGPEADWARSLRRRLEDRFNAMAPVAVV